MIFFDSKTKQQLIDLYDQKKISIEGNILKLIDVSNDEKFSEYITQSIEKDRENRKKRLDITKQIQIQNKKLLESKESLELSQKELEESLEKIKASMNEAESSKQQAEIARKEAESARLEAESARLEAETAKSKVENDLDILQKKTQNELIGTIVKVALWVIVSVGFTTTIVYLLALLTNKDTQVVASTWSNIIGILLTNAFSIVGTIMGVKYASEK